MRSSLADTVKHILSAEGGWANNPKDPGGCTMRGITLATWRAHGHPRATCAGLRRITEAQAGDIYTRTYWALVQGDRLPVGVDLMVCDHAVNAGTKRAVLMLQALVGATEDGDLGPKTVAAAGRVWDLDPGRLVHDLAKARRDYYRSLRVLFRTFGRGWLARVSAAEAAAIRLVAAAKAQPLRAPGSPQAPGQAPDARA